MHNVENTIFCRNYIQKNTIIILNYIQWIQNTKTDNPRFFAGECLIRGLRDELAKLFDLSPSHISNLCRDVPYKHRSYSNFQRNADYIIEEILFCIKSSSMDRHRKNVLMSS